MARKTSQTQEDRDKAIALIPPRMTILSDHPILRVEDSDLQPELDSFALQSRLGTVFDIIRHKNTRAPIAVAVYGDWGTGKSSAMRWLEKQLDRWSKLSKDDRAGHKKTRTIWFDPWKFQKREDVWRGLIAEVILNTIDIEKASLQTVMSAAKKFGLFLGRSFLNVLSSTELEVGAEALGGKAKVDLEALNKIAEDYKQTAHPEKAYLNEFETALKDWVSEALGDDERMVIFIDDLDRCLPAVTLEVLEALKLYLNIPQLVFVVGLDRDVVDAVVRKHYDQTGLGATKAAQYLDKMFQVEVDIPPTQTQMKDYLPGQIKALDKTTDGYWSRMLDAWDKTYRKIIEDKIGDLAEHNPREIKRLLNSTLLRGAAAAHDERLGGPDSKEHERFTQGCQVFLIQRVLRKFVPESGGLMLEEGTWKFLELWSQFVRDYPQYRRSRAEDQKAERASSKLPAADTSSDADAAYERLQQAQPTYAEQGKTRPHPLLVQDHLWDLVRIPFSKEVAAATSVAQESTSVVDADSVVARAVVHEPVVSVVRPRTTIASMPRVLISAIARRLNKGVEFLEDKDLPHVVNLWLDEAGLDDADVAHLGKLTSLQELYLGKNRIADEGLRHIAKIKSLQFIDLGGNQIKGPGLKDFVRLPSLHSLVLSGNQLTGAMLEHLAGLASLQELSLDDNQITDAGLKHLAGLLSLRALSLGGNQITDEGLGHVAKLASLEGLSVDGNQITDAGLVHLSRLAKLSVLSIRNTNTTKVGREKLKKAIPLLKLHA